MVNPSKIHEGKPLGGAPENDSHFALQWVLPNDNGPWAGNVAAFPHVDAGREAIGFGAPKVPKLMIAFLLFEEQVGDLLGFRDASSEELGRDGASKGPVVDVEVV
jgi:hypothetical protein